MSPIKNIRFDGKFEPLDFAMRIQNVNVNTRLHRTQLIFILPLKNAGHLPKTTEKHNSNELSARWLFLFSCIFAVCSQSFPVFYHFDIVFFIFCVYFNIFRCNRVETLENGSTIYESYWFFLLIFLLVLTDQQCQPNTTITLF